MLQPGNVIGGKYEIKETIGQGTFGRVYRAEDVSLGREVAIKELLKGEGEVGSTDYARFADRFRREARVQAQFKHPNIAHVYELLEPAPDAMYLVMEYVDGRSLSNRLAGGSGLPTEEAVRITLGLLEGLSTVHQHPWDIVHRDIKPSNVLLTGKGQPKLADFGVAQVADESMRTGWGESHPGTPLYMSPEQAETTAYLLPASDLFSVGCVLFEMLTGVPYRKATGMGKSLHDLRPDVPDWLERVVAKSLEKESEQRYRSAREFAGALEQGLLVDRQRREHRSRLIPILVGGLALLLVVVLAIGDWRVWEKRRSADATATQARLWATQTAEAMAQVPTDTPTWTPSPTDTPMWTPSPTDTSTWTSSPTDTPTATATPAATNTPTPPAPTDTPVPATPMDTPLPPTAQAGSLLPAPTLLAPRDGTYYSESFAEIILRWSAVKPSLAPDEYYLITISFKHENEIWTDYAWTQETNWSVAEHKYLPGLSHDGLFHWSVKLIHQTGTRADGVPEGIPLSQPSVERSFIWKFPNPTPASARKKRSCPWVFAWNGTDFVEDNDIYSVARYPQGEYTDYYLLQQPLVAQDDEYVLEIREIAEEDSWTDMVGLLAVDHEPDVRVGPDNNGDIHAYRPAELVTPISAVSSYDSDVRALVATMNDSGYRAYSGDYVDIDFGSIDISGGARLVLRVKGFNTGEGEEKPYIGPPAIVVQALDQASNWREVGRLKPRFEWSEGVYELLPYLPDSNGHSRIRLYSISHGVKFHEIDYVALSVGPEPFMDIH